MADIKLFGKWTYKELNIGDITLEDFIAIKDKDHVRSSLFPTRKDVQLFGCF